MQTTISTTRRNLLAGGAVVMLAGAVPAVSGEHPDAELLDLERQIEALLPDLTQAVRAHEAAHNRAMAMLPPEPSTLDYSAHDWSIGLSPPRLRVWNKHHVADYRAKGPQSADVEARFEEILAAERNREQVWHDVADASGWKQAGDDEGALWDRAEAIFARAREIDPQTLEGVAIMARFIAFEAWHLLFMEPEQDMDWEPQVARRLVAGMMRLGGRDFLPRPLPQA